jgi:membrane protease subunit (stomatin/prohibitin family)
MFARRMVRRGVRRGIRRSFVRLSRAAIISMAGVASGVTLATIAAREGVSEEEAEEMMDGLVDEGVLKKETRNGETVYVSTSAAGVKTEVQPKTEPSPAAAPAAGVKFCRNCGAKVPQLSKFCEACGANLGA